MWDNAAALGPRMGSPPCCLQCLKPADGTYRSRETAPSLKLDEGKEDSISPSALTFAVIGSKLWIYQPFTRGLLPIDWTRVFCIGIYSLHNPSLKVSSHLSKK